MVNQLCLKPRQVMLQAQVVIFQRFKRCVPVCGPALQLVARTRAHDLITPHVLGPEQTYCLLRACKRSAKRAKLKLKVLSCRPRPYSLAMNLPSNGVYAKGHLKDRGVPRLRYLISLPAVLVDQEAHAGLPS